MQSKMHQSIAHPQYHFSPVHLFVDCLVSIRYFCWGKVLQGVYSTWKSSTLIQAIVVVPLEEVCNALISPSLISYSAI